METFQGVIHGILPHLKGVYWKSEVAISRTFWKLQEGREDGGKDCRQREEWDRLLLLYFGKTWAKCFKQDDLMLSEVDFVVIYHISVLSPCWLIWCNDRRRRGAWFWKKYNKLCRLLLFKIKGISRVRHVVSQSWRQIWGTAESSQIMLVRRQTGRQVIVVPHVLPDRN